MEAPILTHMNIMIDGLKRKANALVEILAITENQSTVIESELPLAGVREMIVTMNEEKQSHIQIVKDCDAMFEKMLKDIGPELEAQQENFKPQVKLMQEHIRKVMSTDVKIRVTEGENNEKLDLRRAKEFPQTQVAGQTGLKPKVSIPPDSVKVLKAYEQGAKNYKG